VEVPADDQPTRDVTDRGAATRAVGGEVAALVLVWAREEPARIGEVILVGGPQVLGRGDARPDDPAPRARLVRQRPGALAAAPPIASSGVSRVQLELAPEGDGVRILQKGKRPLRVGGREVERAVLAPGDTFAIEEQLLFLVTRRAPAWPATGADASAPFGAADAHGVVGESPAAWALRAAIAFAARAPAHVLVAGPSGAGKELVARAIHDASPRGGRPMIARNAATLPDALIDAELFGNVRGYPNPGMAERPGLVGEADGSTLFLDEIGELPAALQAHLLRLLDRDGEYQRLGEAKPRRADLRVVAATNRDPAALKHDLAARLALRVVVPGLDARAEDVPLILQHVLGEIAARDAHLVARFKDPAGRFRVEAALVDALVHHRFTTHVRELERIVWQAAAESPGDTLAAGPLTHAALEAVPAAAADATAEPATDPGPEALQAALAAAGGSVTAAARALGFKNRFVLYRLLKKHGLE
jgi:two-component system nitrogen regulation response regulator GlnG/two-component system response regulator HydG